MSEFRERISNLSPKRLALLALELQSKVETLEGQKQEPVAVIGMGCRYPWNIGDPESFWELLRASRDAIREVPPDRWKVDNYYDPDPDAPGKIATRWGGFLKDIDQFDPDFFGIAPREAINMDPQQRLILEVGWEALENAGYAPDNLIGSKTGVYVGICNADYYQLNMSGDKTRIDAYLASGSAGSVASGRLSYLLGLQGPSISIDTACSSSLVAVHLACQSLRNGESYLVLAGGVNVILQPEVTMTLSRAHMMAADGRCKAFDAAADGFVRAEGCGLIVMKRLSDAVSDGDRILAVIRGSAVNQDGRSSGLTAPNGPAQEAVIRQALAAGGVGAGEVQYVEAHGTGTSLGDPIEVRALGAVYGEGRSKSEALLIGSVKTNIGHLEATAGIAGLMKVVLALQHGEIPGQLHLKQLNPHVNWEELPIEVVTGLREWGRGEKKRRAGVSSFGFSGTNAHVVLEEGPEQSEREEGRERPRHLLALSGKSEEGLREVARRYEERLKGGGEERLGDICYTANSGRAHFGHRLAVVGESVEGICEQLREVAEGKAAGIRGQMSGTDRPRVAFLFTGQGSQYVGMGRELYETEAGFRRVLERCDEILKGEMEESLLGVLYGGGGRRMDETGYTQPVLYALEYGIADLWKRWGIEPSVVMGHSVGEYVAATVAGVMSLEEGLRLMAARGRLMQGLALGGRMEVVFGEEGRVREAIRGYEDRVSIAAVNGRENVVISGGGAEVGEIVEKMKGERVKTQSLTVSHAFHSPLMEPMLEEYERVAGGVSYQKARVGWVSNVTGEMGEVEGKSWAGYWRRHAREAVQFEKGMRTLERQNCQVYVEIGPSPVLLGMGRRSVGEGKGEWLASLRKGRGDWEQLLESLGRLYVRGAKVDWAGYDREYRRRKVSLPTYPFQRQRYWVDASPADKTADRLEAEVASPTSSHPLLSGRLATAVPLFEARLSVEKLPYLIDHTVRGVILTPGALFLELIWAAAKDAFGTGMSLESMELKEPLIIPDHGEKLVQLAFSPIQEGRSSFSVFGWQVDADGGGWKLHATGEALDFKMGSPRPSEMLATIQKRCSADVGAEDFYQQLDKQGFRFGPAFRTIKRLWWGENEVLGEIVLERGLPQTGYQAHPALLDGCIQVLGAAVAQAQLPDTYLQSGLEAYQSLAAMGRRLWSHARLRPSQGTNHLVGDVCIFNEDGEPIAEVKGVQLKRSGLDLVSRLGQGRHSDWFYDIQWETKPLSGIGPANWLPKTSVMGGSLASSLSKLRPLHGLTAYDQLAPKLDGVCASYVIRAFHQMGWQFEVGKRVSFAELVSVLKVVPIHHRLLERMLGILEEEGLMKRCDGDAWEVTSTSNEGIPEEQSRAMLEEFPAYDAVLMLLARCGGGLAESLQGRQDPLQLLFPNGDFSTTEKLYQESPSARVFNRLIQESVAIAIEKLPPGRKLRILEVGAGTGATTSFAMKSLPPHAEYTFTDISPLFVARAQDKFKNSPQLNFLTLDIEQLPADQGLPEHSFDIILAANVLHATRDLGRTFEHVKKLLAPEGMLVLLEGTHPQRWVDLTFGLTEGWWRFSDHEVRTHHPLLSQSQWKIFLDRQGFTGIEAVPENPDKIGQAILLARGPRLERKPSSDGCWVILANEGGVGEELAGKLHQERQSSVLVRPGAHFQTESKDRYRIDPDDPSHYVRLLNSLSHHQYPVLAVIQTWSMDMQGAGDPNEVGRQCWRTIITLQALLSVGSPAKLWLATRGSQPVEGRLVSPAQSSLWGLGRVIALEHPVHWGGQVDLDPDRPELSAVHLMTEILETDGEDQIAYRAGIRQVPRLRRSTPPISKPPNWRSDAAYLITGGLGGLGLQLAEWMARQGAGHLVLLSRSGLPDRERWDGLAAGSNVLLQAKQARDIEAAGARVTIARGDVSDAEAMKTLFSRFGGDLPPLRGVLHAAVNMTALPLKTMDRESLDSMLAAKVAGTWNLHRFTEKMNLDFFVLFSSTTALWGAQDLAHYAAANLFLDGVAHWRRSHGLPALAINWGTWDLMRVASTEQKKLFSSAGLNPMASAEAVEILGDLLGGQIPQITVASVDWSLLKPLYESKRHRPFLERVDASGSSESRSLQKANAAMQWQFDTLPASQRLESLRNRVRAEVAKVLGLGDPDSIDAERGLFEMGMDSLMSVELKSRLERCVGKPLPSTLTFNYPNVEALTHFIAVNILELSGSSSGSAVERENSTTGSKQEASASSELSEEELEVLLLKKLEQV
ncbi:MAG: beta-ketoacyl synthase N-terminal-like domain-containing protein [Terriglobia bacterium]